MLAAESLAAKDSGIGRVARLMAKVLSEHLAEHRAALRGISLSDEPGDLSEWPWAVSCAGNRLAYVLRLQARGLRASSMVYDSLSMARGHFMGPARWRSALAWMHGIDVWEAARAEHVRVAQNVDLLLTNTEYTRRRAAALHPGLERATVCWLGSETDAVPRSERPPDRPTVLLLSRIDRESYKGHRELIAAWPGVLERVPRARLVIAGAGPGIGEVRALARSSPATANIELIGYVPEAELPALWGRTTVLAMPSRGEGFGLTYVEAMRHGIPVVASREDAGQEVNVDGETGFNVARRRPRELVEALTALLGDRDRARVMGMAGRERWLRHFTFSAFKGRFLRILDETNFLARRMNEQG